MRLPQGFEWLIIAAIILLLFGAKRMPDAARGLGRSLRIFKAETKGLTDGDEDPKPADVAAPPATATIAAPVVVPPIVSPPAALASVDHASVEKASVENVASAPKDVPAPERTEG